MVHINLCENVVTNIFELIGNNSIIALCIHSIEYVGIPWYWFREFSPNMSDEYVFCLIFVLRLALIFLVTYVVNSSREKNKIGF